MEQINKVRRVVKKQINDQVVRPVRIITGKSLDLRPIKGSELFEEIYCNCLILAKKKTGKTTVLYKIVKDCCTNETTVIVFSATVDKDPIQIEIKKYCKKMKIPYVGYTSMKDEDVDVLEVLVNKLTEEARERALEENPPSNDEGSEESYSDSEDGEYNRYHPNRNHNHKPKTLVLFEDSEEDSEVDEHRPKKRKNKYRAPEYLIILDDLSNELKSKVLAKLSKTNRWYNSKLIMSTQYKNDILPEIYKQFDYALLFRGEPLEKLETIHKDLDLSTDFELFQQLYYNATEKPHNFLYIDVRNEKYRHNFTHAYDIKD